jgi:hypothetical protein
MSAVERFHDLHGVDLCRFAVEQTASPDRALLEHILRRFDALDDPHLEMALFILSHDSCSEATGVLCAHLEHPVTYVRMAAIRGVLGRTGLTQQQHAAVKSASASGLFGTWALARLAQQKIDEEEGG